MQASLRTERTQPTEPTARKTGTPTLQSPHAGSETRTAYLSRGQRIAGRYEIRGVLGEGGMGVVYRCRDLETKAPVAIKRVTLPTNQGEDCLSYLLIEAQALARLDHPHIVRAHDFGVLYDGTPYLCLDLLQGISLQQLATTTQDFSLVWVLIQQILSALGHAHARGVVHGDLKPSNVLVETDAAGLPEVRLFDFGLAKPRGPDLGEQLSIPEPSLHPPPGAGTPGYMAPEQILGKSYEIGKMTDLYALGCIVYRLLTHHSPFAVDPELELHFHCLREPVFPEPTMETPREALELVMQLLQKRPHRRAEATAEVRRHWDALEPDLTDLAEAWDRAQRRLEGMQKNPNRDDTTRRLSSAPPPPTTTLPGLLRSERFASGLLSLRPPPFQGRARERRCLREAADQIILGQEPSRAALFLVGASGVGKSRLCDVMCSEMEERGAARVLRGRALRAPEGRARDPLSWAISDALDLGPESPTEARSALRERFGHDGFDRVAGFLFGQLERPLSEASATSAALLGLLGELGRERPLLLWLDDLRELGPAGTLLLEQLGALSALRVLLLLPLTPDGFRDPRAAAALSVLEKRWPTSRLSIPPLSPLGTYQVLHSACPIDSGRALEIATRSRGDLRAALRSLDHEVRAGVDAERFG